MTKTVVVILGLALLVLLGADAQQVGKGVRIGLLSSECSRSFPLFQVFEHRLRELGYVEGQTLALEFRTAEGQVERLPALAAELVQLRVGVLVAVVPAAIHAAKQATTTILIVMAFSADDPVAIGLVASLAPPGGNITGLTIRAPELAAKRLELLKETLPQVSRVAVLWDVLSAEQLREVEMAARALNVELQPLELRYPPYDYEHALSAAVQGRAEALFVLMSPIFSGERARINELVVQHRLPASFGMREFIEGGGLMSYRVNLSDMYRRAADYVDKILKGAKPADLPVERAMKFELVINLKTA